ncbi:hypothetical protein Hanom_Chr11g01046291 [Helianthus anomalus]
MTTIVLVSTSVPSLKSLNKMIQFSAKLSHRTTEKHNRFHDHETKVRDATNHVAKNFWRFFQSISVLAVPIVCNWRWRNHRQDHPHLQGQPLLGRQRC